MLVPDAGSGSSEFRQREGERPIEAVLSAINTEINVYDPDTERILQEQVRLRLAVALHAKTETESRFVGCAMPTGEDLSAMVVVLVNNEAGLLTLPRHQNSENQDQSGESAPGVKAELKPIPDGANLAAAETRQRVLANPIFSSFYPGTSGMEVPVDDANDPHQVISALLNELGFEWGECRSTCFSDQVAEVLAAVQLAFAIAPELKRRRVDASQRVGAGVIACASAQKL